VTTQLPLAMKYLLHKHAHQQRKPVISGYDIAGLQLLHIYDYRKPSVRVLHGKVKEDEVWTIPPFQFLSRVVPISALPTEIIGELRRQIRGERDGFPQIVYTAHLFGVLTLPAILDIIAGRPIRRRVILDIPTLLRPITERARVMAKRLRGLYHLNNEFRRSQRQRSSDTDRDEATLEP
jgi:tRNA threonylcarbamoyladenosine dehydratase